MLISKIFLCFSSCAIIRNDIYELWIVFHRNKTFSSYKHLPCHGDWNWIKKTLHVEIKQNGFMACTWWIPMSCSRMWGVSLYFSFYIQFGSQYPTCHSCSSLWFRHLVLIRNIIFKPFARQGKFGLAKQYGESNRA